MRDNFCKIAECHENETLHKCKLRALRRLHPDKGGSTEGFNQLAEVYEDLEKHVYDERFLTEMTCQENLAKMLELPRRSWEKKIINSNMKTWHFEWEKYTAVMPLTTWLGIPAMFPDLQWPKNLTICTESFQSFPPDLFKMIANLPDKISEVKIPRVSESNSSVVEPESLVDSVNHELFTHNSGFQCSFESKPGPTLIFKRNLALEKFRKMKKIYGYDSGSLNILKEELKLYYASEKAMGKLLRVNDVYLKELEDIHVVGKTLPLQKLSKKHPRIQKVSFEDITFDKKVYPDIAPPNNEGLVMHQRKLQDALNLGNVPFKVISDVTDQSNGRRKIVFVRDDNVSKFRKNMIKNDLTQNVWTEILLSELASPFTRYHTLDKLDDSSWFQVPPTMRFTNGFSVRDLLKYVPKLPKQVEKVEAFVSTEEDEKLIQQRLGHMFHVTRGGAENGGNMTLIRLDDTELRDYSKKQAKERAIKLADLLAVEEGKKKQLLADKKQLADKKLADKKLAEELRKQLEELQKKLKAVGKN